MSGESITGEEHNQGKLVTAAGVSMLGSVILFFISAAVGIMVDSITLILDAAASLVIFAAALLIHYAIRKINQPPNNFYHYGYHKYEPFTAVVQRGLIIVTCLISMGFAIQDILHAEDISSYSLPAIATFFSGILGLAVTVYLRRISRQINSPMIKAAGLHWMSDAVLSLGVCGGFLFGLMVPHFGYSQIKPYVDPVMAIGLALCLMLMPVKGFMNDLFELLDAAPANPIRNQVRKVVDLYKPRAFGVHRLRTRAAGRKIFVDVCFLVRDSLTMASAQELADGFERDLKTHIPDCDVIVYFKVRR